MLILMVSFSIWGIGDMFRGNPLQKTVATIGNTEISVQELNHLFEQTLQQARGMMPDLTTAQARQMGLLDTTLNNAIKRDLVDQDIQRLGIIVSPDAVLSLVANQPQFRTKDGSFNKALFRQLLEQQHLTESGFIAQGQQDLSRQILLAALNSAHVIPQTAIDAVYAARTQKRTLDVITVDAAKIGGIATPDDKQLHDFYDQNPTLFAAPEYRSLTIATLTTDGLAKDIVVTDDQAKKEYDTKPEQFAQPEQRDVVQVVLQDEAKATELAQQARKKGDLTAAAKQADESAIPMEGLEEKSLMPELSKPVFALHEGDITDPVKTQLGWHVVQVKKITAAGTPAFASIKDKLKEDMKRDQAVEAATRIVNQLDDQLAAGHSLDDIADELHLRLVKIAAVDASGTLANGSTPKEFPNKGDVLKSGFTQNAGETSPIADDKAGNYYVVRTDDVTPSGAKPYDTVKDTIAAAWKTHEQAVKAQAEADAIAKDLQGGKPVSAIASQPGVSVRLSSPLSQLGDTDPLLPQQILSQAFKLKKGETVAALQDSKQIIAQLNSVTDADTSKPDPRKGMIGSDIKKTLSDEFLEQYVQHLYTVFPVKTNAAVLDHLRQQDN